MFIYRRSRFGQSVIIIIIIIWRWEVGDGLISTWRNIMRIEGLEKGRRGREYYCDIMQFCIGNFVYLMRSKVGGN